MYRSPQFFYLIADIDIYNYIGKNTCHKCNAHKYQCSPSDGQFVQSELVAHLRNCAHQRNKIQNVNDSGNNGQNCFGITCCDTEQEQ